MARADWGDENGSTVTFKLPMVHSEDARNPFHTFTKRRKGKAGTRFMMACHTASEGLRQALYEDEAMLAGWNDSQQNGHTVKLWLCNDNMGHPFEGWGRDQELIIALTELDDDNEPIDQKMRERVEKQHDTGKQKLSNVAAILCVTPEFWLWASNTQYLDGIMATDVSNEEMARQWMYQMLGINSRSELDRNQLAATHFHRNIREPYQKWYASEYGASC